MSRMALSTLSLRSRLLAAFIVVALFGVATAGFALSRMGVVSERAQDVYQQGTLQVDGARSLQALWWEYETHDSRLLIPEMPASALAEAQEGQVRANEDLNARIKEVQALGLSGEVAKNIQIFAESIKTRQDLVSQLKAGVSDQEQHYAILAELTEAAALAEKAIVDASAAAQKSAAAEAASANDAYEAARTMTIVIIGAGLALSVALGIICARSVSRPIGRTRDVLAKVADGDLTVRVEEVGPREIAEMNGSLNVTLGALGSVMMMVRDSAQRLAGSSAGLNGTAGAIAVNVEGVAQQAELVSASAPGRAVTASTSRPR